MVTRPTPNLVAAKEVDSYQRQRQPPCSLRIVLALLHRDPAKVSPKPYTFR